MPTTTDHDIDFTFADDGDLVRKAPKAVPEDPVEKRLQREREAAPFIAEATGFADEYDDAWVEAQRAKVDEVADRLAESELKRRHRMGMTRPFEMTSKDIVARGEAMHRAIEVKHGSGKVKV